MHSSRMRTTRSLTASCCIWLGGGACVARGHAWRGVCVVGRGHAWKGCVCGGGVHDRGGMRGKGACVARGLARRGRVWLGVCAQRTPPCGQTDRCKNITLPQTSFADGNDIHSVHYFISMNCIEAGEDPGFLAPGEPPPLGSVTVMY